MEPEALGFDAGLDELPKATARVAPVVRGAWAPPNRPKRIASLTVPAALAVSVWS